MGKIFATNDDVVEVIENKWAKTGLDVYGLNLKIMSTTKAKDIIKVSKASPTTEFLTKKEDMVQVIVYESAFERLPREVQDRIAEMALVNVSFDNEKGKVNVDSSPYNMLFAMRRKYGEVAVNDLELCSIVMQEIIDEEKARKQEEKEAKKLAKANRN